MDNTFLKAALVGVAAYVGYTYLKSSGLWSQWFGGSSFTDAPSLLAYCTQNPTGTASFNGQSAPCSAWIQAAQGSAAGAAPSNTPSTTTPQPAPAPAAAPLVSALQLNQAALQNGTAIAAGYTGPNSTLTVDEWNYFETQINPSAQAIVNWTPLGLVRGVNDSVTAAAYIALRQQGGLSGLRGMGYFESPYRWKM